MARRLLEELGGRFLADAGDDHLVAGRPAGPGDGTNSEAQTGSSATRAAVNEVIAPE